MEFGWLVLAVVGYGYREAALREDIDAAEAAPNTGISEEGSGSVAVEAACGAVAAYADLTGFAVGVGATVKNWMENGDPLRDVKRERRRGNAWLARTAATLGATCLAWYPTRKNVALCYVVGAVGVAGVFAMAAGALVHEVRLLRMSR